MEFLGQDRREGLGRKAHSRFVLVLLILVSVLLLLSSLYSAQASVFKKAREGVLDAASPVLSLLAGPISYVNGVFGSVTDYFNVMEQNEALRAENAELRQWMNEALELRETVATYEALEGYLAPPNAQPINAFVIGEANDAFARSMIVNAEAIRDSLLEQNEMDGPVFKIKHDPRITRLGRFIRKYSLDEFPQLFNVWRGEMSLVGPRPEDAQIVALYDDYQRQRLLMKPGITGPMQINGRGDLSLRDRIALELDYIQHYTLWRDIDILLKTVPTVLSSRGAR